MGIGIGDWGLGIGIELEWIAIGSNQIIILVGEILAKFIEHYHQAYVSVLFNVAKEWVYV